MVRQHGFFSTCRNPPYSAGNKLGSLLALSTSSASYRSTFSSLFLSVTELFCVDWSYWLFYSNDRVLPRVCLRETPSNGLNRVTSRI